ncbi:MAG: hypothetical protein FWC47_17640 [Oscillospiraceae bacterium]|nr:hypothetical protein [Oscillospiraceae bacterium]
MKQLNYKQKTDKKKIKKENEIIKDLFKILLFLIILLIVLPSREAVRWGIIYSHVVEKEDNSISISFDTKELLTLNVKNVKNKIFSFYNMQFNLAQIKQSDNNIILRFLKNETWSFAGDKAVFNFVEEGQSPTISYVTITGLDALVIYRENINLSDNMFSFTLKKNDIEMYSKININISNSKVIEYKLRFMPSKK